MPSLIDIRRRIRSVKNTQQITKAMKMVSAAKLRRAQDRVIAARPYVGQLRQMLADVAVAVSAGEEASANPLLAQRPEERILLVLYTADKGLAGAFNTNLIKRAQRFLTEGGIPDEELDRQVAASASEEAKGAGAGVTMDLASRKRTDVSRKRAGVVHAGPAAAPAHEETAAQGGAVMLELIGRKGRDFFRKRGATIVSEHVGLSGKPAYDDTAAIAREAIDKFRNCEIDAVYLLYNEFKSVMSQKLKITQVLPVPVPDKVEGADYIFEQPAEELLNELLPRYVEMEFFRALLESTAAEHAARMTAMEAATSNAAEMIDKLTLHMNRVRQASITKEIIEVVSGAAAGE